jgi:hypothetical protein
MSADNYPAPSDDSLQQIFDEIPFIEHDFLLEAKWVQEDYFEAKKKWESVGPLLEKMLESGLPVEAGRFQVCRVEGDRRFEILDTWTDEENARHLERLFPGYAKGRKMDEVSRKKREAGRNRTLQRFGLPPL